MGLQDWLRDRAGKSTAVPPPLPAVYEVTLSADDEALELDDELGSEEALGEALFIVYRDSKGAESRRRITVHRIAVQGGTALLRCWCHERQASRTFRADRIIELVDMTSGEVLDTPEEIGERLRAMAAAVATEDAATMVALKARRYGLVALTFLARCDGYEHPAEREVILRYLDVAAPPPGIDEEAAGVALDRLYPDEESYATAIDRLAVRPEELRELARYALELVEADGTYATEEFEFMAELRDLLAEVHG